MSTLLPNGYIDAHHHVWAPETLGDQIGYGWLRDIGAPKPFGDPTPIQRDYRMEEFLGEAPVQPRASVHVQTDGTLPDPVAETRFVQADADRCGHPVRIVGLADLRAADLADTLDHHAQSPAFCGVRQIVAKLDDRPDISFAPEHFLRDAVWRKGLKTLEDRGLTFDLQMYPEQAAEALEALSETPALTVVIDHALCPHDMGAEGYETWSEAVAQMAARPNTYMKLSGFGMYQTDWSAHGAGAIGPYLDDILVNFGSARVMWGSNYPVEKLATPYATCLQAIAMHVPQEDRENVFIHSAAKAYGVKLT